ncbi:MAG: methionine synthase [Dehalococcoidales bacterium]
MPYKEFGCLPTLIGSMPQTDPQEACSQIIHYLKDIPAWPQLPKRSFLENMYVQFSQGFPGVVVKGDRIFIDRSQDLDKPLEELYTAYLANDIDKYPISQENAAGLYSFLAMPNLSPLAVKGQITGPVTWGLTVTDDTGKGILYDDILGDAVPRLLRLKAAWQEKELRQVCRDTIIFIDEPYMSAFGSVSVMLSREKVISLLEEVIGGIDGIKGVHCCGNTDWSILLGTSVDIVSFDTYNYAQSLSLYPAEVRRFLDRGGTIAWGVVPNDEDSLAKESVASLKDHLEEAMAPFTREGVRFKQLIEQGLLTPSCGLASLASGEAAARALELLAELSIKIRKRYM